MLLPEDADLDLGRVQPNNVRKGVVELDRAQNAEPSILADDLMERAAHMCVDVIGRRMHLAYLWVPAAHHSADPTGDVLLDTGRSHAPQACSRAT